MLYRADTDKSAWYILLKCPDVLGIPTAFARDGNVSTDAKIVQYR